MIVPAAGQEARTSGKRVFPNSQHEFSRWDYLKTEARTSDSLVVPAPLHPSRESRDADEWLGSGLKIARFGQKKVGLSIWEEAASKGVGVGSTNKDAGGGGGGGGGACFARRSREKHGGFLKFTRLAAQYCLSHIKREPKVAASRSGWYDTPSMFGSQKKRKPFSDVLVSAEAKDILSGTDSTAGGGGLLSRRPSTANQFRTQSAPHCVDPRSDPIFASSACSAQLELFERRLACLNTPLPSEYTAATPATASLRAAAAPSGAAASTGPELSGLPRHPLCTPIARPVVSAAG